MTFIVVSSLNRLFQGQDFKYPCSGIMIITMYTFAGIIVIFKRFAPRHSAFMFREEKRKNKNHFETSEKSDSGQTAAGYWTVSNVCPRILLCHKLYLIGMKRN